MCAVLSHVHLFATLWTVARQAPLSMVFSRQEYWNGLPFPPLGDLPNPGFKPGSPALQVDSLPLEPSENRQDASFNWQLSLKISYPKLYHITLTKEHHSSIDHNSGISTLFSWWPWTRWLNSFFHFTLCWSFQNLFSILPYKNKYFPIYWFSHCWGRPKEKNKCGK